MGAGRLAIVTLVRNEPFFLPRWLEYYGRTGADLYVLDHESDDGSTDNLPGVTVATVRHELCEPAQWMLRTVQQKMADLLVLYDRVGYAEVDEFLIPDPARWNSLSHFLDENPDDFLGAEGWNVVHQKDDLPLCDSPVVGLLEDRCWKREPLYDMTLIGRKVPNWKIGRHGLNDRPNVPSKGLRLVHLHYTDPELGWERILARKRGKAFAPDGCGYQNKFATRKAFDAHWGSMCGGGEPIPREWWAV